MVNSISMLSIVCITNDFAIFPPHNVNIAKLIIAYATFLLFIILYIGYKLLLGRGTLWITLVTEIVVLSGLEEVEVTTARDVTPCLGTF